MIQRNLDQKGALEKSDRDMAFLIMLAEREYHIRIDDDFPVSKFLNWFDKYNLDKYKKMMNSSTPSKGSKPTTFRG